MQVEPAEWYYCVMVKNVEFKTNVISGIFSSGHEIQCGDKVWDIIHNCVI